MPSRGITANRQEGSNNFDSASGYSALSATIGSIFIARQAGIRLAAMVVIKSKSGIKRNVQASRALV
jgi:hypothetical protein